MTIDEHWSPPLLHPDYLIPWPVRQLWRCRSEQMGITAVRAADQCDTVHLAPGSRCPNQGQPNGLVNGLFRQTVPPVFP